MYACFTKNLKDEMKVAQLAAYVSEKTSYHHGETSLADTVVKLAHTYTGSNNVNLLEPCGQFGTRLMGGKDASQTRYIFTKLSNRARTYFHPDDDSVLNYLTDDGHQIEPEHYVPVMPFVLVNGTEGIGTGFSCSVPSFNPVDIRENVTRGLSGKSMKKMTPWYQGFTGTIVEESDQRWIATGKYQDVGVAKRVTELPPGRWTQDYKEFLETMVDKKVISNYKNNSTTEDVDFTVYDYAGTDFVKDMKLQKSINATNMHLFHPTKGIVKYDTAEDIIKDFIEIRSKFYDFRKSHMVMELHKLVTVLQNKAKFVKMVVNDELVIFKKKRSVFEHELASIFPKIDDSYDYLLNIKTWQYTDESIAALTKDANTKSAQLDTMKNTSKLEMWEKDMLST
jgi:DNA topoisomerase-2